MRVVARRAIGTAKFWIVNVTGAAAVMRPGPRRRMSAAAGAAGSGGTAVSTWLNSGVDPVQLAAWAGHSVAVLMRIYVKCISGHDAEAKRRILAATKPGPTRSAQASETA